MSASAFDGDEDARAGHRSLRVDSFRVASVTLGGSVTFTVAGAAVEREFGRLKHDYGPPLRVRGLERVQLPAGLTILARLAQALSRAREAVPLAAWRQ